MTRALFVASCAGAMAASSVALGALVTVGSSIEIAYDSDQFQGGVNAVNIDVNLDGVEDVGFGWRWGPTAWQAIAGGPWADPTDIYGSITPGAMGVVTTGADELRGGASVLSRRFGTGDSIGGDFAGALSGDNESYLAEEHYVPPNMSDRSGEWLGAAANGYKRRGFVGFAFVIDGQTHWGWVDVTVNHADPFDGFIRIHGWGYETDAMVAAAAAPIPAPGSAGALAMLGAALARRRR